MTAFAWDVPGYVQGSRFSSDTRYWNGVSFRDLAGYGHLGNDVQLVAGTPAFSAHGANSRVGLLLNNANTYKFHPRVPWEGSMLFVVKPTMATAPLTLYPWLFGCVAAEASNGHVRLNRSGTTINLVAATPSSAIALSLTSLVAGAIAIFAYSFNQTDRIGRSTRDGVTITASAPAGDVLGHGNAVAIRSVSSPPPIPDIGGISHDYVRMGDNLGTGSLVPNSTDYLHVFEQHFWKGDVLLNNAALLAAFITSLREYYGI